MHPLDLSPRIIQQFLVLVQEKHFGRAADRLGISQPSLSQAINRLERSVGFILLKRTSRSVELTPAGAAFAHDMQILADAQNQAVTRGRRIAAGDEGELQLGTTGSFAYAFIPGLIRRCHQESPNLHIHLHDCPSLELIDRVRDGRVDIALAAGPLPDTTGLTVRFVTYESIILVLPADHRLADRLSIDLADLADDDFALYSETGHSGLMPIVTSACQAAGFTPRQVASADTVAGLIGHVASGLCVSFAPSRMRQFNPPGVVFKPVTPWPASPDKPNPPEILKIQILSVVREDHHEPLIDNVLRLLQDPTIVDIIPDRTTADANPSLLPGDDAA